MDSFKKSKFSKDKNIDEEIDQETNDIINELSKIPKMTQPIPKGNKIKLNKFDAIPWDSFFPNTYLLNDRIPIYWKGDIGPNLVCLHGAGHSALSFAPLAGVDCKYRIISFDHRGHGNSSYTSSDAEDLSQETLIKDTIEVLEYIEKTFIGESIIIVGHSMGGSIATKTSAEIFQNKDKYPSLYDAIQGLIVIDVVEGTAMDALPFMENIVKSRPNKFKSVDEAVEYMYKSGTIKNISSARVSVPSLIRQEGSVYTWKTNLLSSKKFWCEWFEGLTKCFLSIKIPKILLLAASDRMDKDLTIAQMQGKYKLSVINNVGHLIHEDDPKATYNVIDNFITTFRIAAKTIDMKPIIGKLGTNKPNIIKYDQNI